MTSSVTVFNLFLKNRCTWVLFLAKKYNFVSIEVDFNAFTDSFILGKLMAMKQLWVSEFPQK